MNKEKQFEWNENRVDEFIEDIQNHISGSFRHYDFAQWKENFKQSKIEPVKQPLPEKESTFVLRLLETDSKFLETSASMIPYDGNNWYYMPFWFKKVGDNLYAEYPFDKLPNGLKKEIEKMRNMGREKALNEDTVVKPPLGIIPEWLWKEDRYHELSGAINRYRESLKSVPQEWINEKYELEKYLLARLKSKTDTVVDDNEDWDKPNKEQEQFYWDGIEKENEKQPPLVDNSNIPDEILSEWITKARPLVDSAFNVGIDAVLKTINEWEIVYIPPELISQIHNLKKPITQ